MLKLKTGRKGCTNRLYHPARKEKNFSTGFFFILFFMVCTAACLFAQAAPARSAAGASADMGGPADNSIRFKRTVIEEGMPPAAIQCIWQDRFGFMWFGTADGLYRYDGYEVVAYRRDLDNPDSIVSNDIRCLFEDSKGILWIGSKDRGLDAFNPLDLSFTHYRHDENFFTSLSHDDISAIAEDRDGNLWVGTRGGGLNKFDWPTRRFLAYSTVNGNLSHNDVTAILVDSHVVIWVGTAGGGLNRFDKEAQQFTAYRHDPGNPRSLSSDAVSCIFEDSSGTLWVGTTDSGLDRFDKDTGTCSHFTAESSGLASNFITSISEDPEKVLWIGTGGGGLCSFDRARQRFSSHVSDPVNPYSLGDNDILSLYKDRSGITWIGTAGGSIHRYSHSWNIFQRYAPGPQDAYSLGNGNVTAFWEDASGMIWVGTAGGGINRFDPQTKRFSIYHPETGKPGEPMDLRNDPITALCGGTAGELWVGTAGSGLRHLDTRTGTWTSYRSEPGNRSSNSISHDDIRALFFDERRGALWAGTAGGGLNRFDPRYPRFTVYRYDPANSNSIGHDDIRCIYRDSSGVLWLGTYGGGLDRLDTHTLRFDHVNTDNSGISSNYVECMYEDKYGILWIGTNGGGLNRFTRSTGEIKVYREKEGLADDVISGILADRDGNLWLSTGKGLSRFDSQSGWFRNYSQDDGLQNTAYHARAFLMNRDGKMFFGGPKGIDVFAPPQVIDDEMKPSIVLTEFLVANRPVSIQRFQPTSLLTQPIYATEKLILSYQQDVFSFDFSVLHYADPKKNRYRYKLEGYNREWVETDWRNRRATYFRIPAGNYTFRVTGANSAGSWNDEGISLKIKILPPPWKTWWAYSLYGLVLLGLIYLIWSNFYFKKLVEAQEKELVLKRELEQKNEQLLKAEGQLIQSEKMASLGTLVANVAHEINNPTGFMQLSAFNLKEDLEEFKKFLDELASVDASERILKAFNEKFATLFKHIGYINEGTTRIGRIVTDLRTFYRQDKGDAQIFRPSQYLMSTMNLVQIKYKEDVDFITSYQDEPEIEGCPAEISQAFMNIILNACQAIQEKKEKEKRGKEWKGKLSIKLTKENKDCVIRFQDEGTGMSKETKNKIFDPFFSTKPERQGTGIGLFITYNIIEKHKGRIEVESIEGQGTSISLYLPLRKKQN